jgi:hypothetical protein
MRMAVRHAYYRESLSVCQLKLCDYGTLSLPGLSPVVLVKCQEDVLTEQNF